MGAILSCLSSTFMTVLWSFVMLGIVYFMGSLVIVSRIVAHFNAMGVDLDVEERDRLTQQFGSVWLSMQSLVLASTGGQDWGEYFNNLESTGGLNQFIFMVFILFVHLALLNIILGIFVDCAMKSLEPDDFERAHFNTVEERRAQQELRALCDEVDVDHTGIMTSSQWKLCIEDQRMTAYLDMLGFPRCHLDDLFHMLCTSQEARGEVVVVEDFVRGCMRMRGTASSFDMNTVKFEVSAVKELLVEEIGKIRALIRSH